MGQTLRSSLLGEEGHGAAHRASATRPGVDRPMESERRLVANS
jgi:hypothetical protein